MKYRRILHRLRKLIPDPRPVTLRVRWVESADLQKLRNSSDLQKLPDSSEKQKPPQDSPAPLPERPGKGRTI